MFRVDVDTGEVAWSVCTVASKDDDLAKPLAPVNKVGQLSAADAALLTLSLCLRMGGWRS